MKKTIYRGIRDISVEEVPDPKPGKGEVKVKIKYCGICGSDLHEYLHGPFPLSPFGHEACGTIEAVGPDVKGFAVGDRVCTLVPGAYAEAVVCPTERLLKIPDDMDWLRAVVLEPLSGAAYAIDRGHVQPSDTVFIAGAGTVGLMLLLGLKAMGVQNIYITDVLENRRQKAQELGATLVWNPAEIKSPAKIKELTGGRGVDVSIEAVGIEVTGLGALPGNGHRPGHFHRTGRCSYAGVCDPRNDNDRHQFHQPPSGHEMAGNGDDPAREHHHGYYSAGRYRQKRL